MSWAAKIVIGLVAILHFYIAWFEIFAWTSRGPIVFSNFPKDLFEPTKVLAANQGIYNSFLAAGLTWSLFIKESIWHHRVATCFLLMVCIAGIFGAITASPKIFLVQTVPALLGIILLKISSKNTAL